MTFNRIADSGAEVDITEIIQLGNEINRSAVLSKTGLYSWEMSTNQGYWGFGFPAKTGIRSGQHFYADTSFPVDDTFVVSMHETLTSTWPHRVEWMKDELRWDLYVNDSLEDQVSTVAMGLIPDSWFHVGMTLDSVGGYCSVYLNGIEVLSFSGAITSDDVDFVSFNSDNGINPFGTFYVDNCYVDEISSEGNAAPPQYEFMAQSTPDGASISNWTPLAAPNWQQVDDGATHDGDTTYNKVSTSAGALEDRHTTADIVLPVDYTIIAAHSYVIAKKLDAAMDAQIEPSVYLGSGSYGDALELPIDYTYLRNRFALQPDTSAWNQADFNSALFGYRAAGSF